MPLWKAMMPASSEVTSRTPAVIPAQGPNISTMGPITKDVASPDSRAAPAASTTWEGP
ncbi:hypothetical protein D3C84_1211440 [compost metagenome]